MLLTALEVPKWKDLNSRVVLHHAVRWRNIGIQLDLVPSLLDSIAENCATKPQRSQECLNAVLEKWLMQDGPNATWSKLEHAITNVQRIELGLDPIDMSMFSIYLFFSYKVCLLNLKQDTLFR